MVNNQERTLVMVGKKESQKPQISREEQLEVMKKALLEHREKTETDPQYRKKCKAWDESLKDFFHNEIEED